MSDSHALSKYLTDYDLAELIDVFPEVDFAFAYGSGAIEQEGYPQHVSRPEQLPMLDLVLGVNNSESWHDINLKRNRSHYSGLAKLLGAKGIASVQEELGAKLYYNALVPMPTTSHRGRSMKYGVISMDHLKTDLADWTWLYIAGRLHKPVRVIKSSEQASPIVQQNLRSAVRTALLLLPETFDAHQFYTTIAGLSYTGDFRMYFGENPDKVKNIVGKSLGSFQDLYAPAIEKIPGLCRTGHGSSNFEQDMSLDGQMALAKALPAAVRGLLSLSNGIGGASGRIPIGPQVSRALAAVVSRSSLRQGLKGVLTAGIAKSASYSAAKVVQALAGRRKQLLAR